VQKNVTITISEEALKWARRKAADENTSVSRLVGQMLEEKMRLSDEYWKAFERWKKFKGVKGFKVKDAFSRDEVHERR